MKTSRILAALVTLSATAAVAGMKLETRTDYQNSTFNDDAGQKGYSTTQVKRAKLAISHKVADGLTVNTRLNFLGSGTPAAYDFDKKGTQTDIVEYANVGYELMPNLTLTMGKLSAIGGGMENQYNRGDLYLVSTMSGSTVAPDAGGMGLTYKMGDHAFDLQVTNDDSTANQMSGATRSMTGVQYYGNFMDKKLQAIASYHTAKYGKVVNGSLDNKEITRTVVGAKFDAGMAIFDLDYGMQVDQANSTGDKKNSVTGFVFNAAVPFMEKWKAIAKYENTIKKVNDDKSNTYDNFGLAAEYSLAPESNFHVAYNSLTNKVEATGKSNKESQVFVGFKVYADIMK